MSKNESIEKRKARHARYYQNNKEKCKERFNKNIDKAREYVQVIKKKSKCIDCGESRWQCLDFDHRDLSQKLYDIHYLTQHGMGKKTIDIELSKCDVRCANCHRIRHAIERGDV